jgi:hypothetical protein
LKYHFDTFDVRIPSCALSAGNVEQVKLLWDYGFLFDEVSAFHAAVSGNAELWYYLAKVKGLPQMIDEMILPQVDQEHYFKFWKVVLDRPDYLDFILLTDNNAAKVSALDAAIHVENDAALDLILESGVEQPADNHILENAFLDYNDVVVGKLLKHGARLTCELILDEDSDLKDPKFPLANGFVNLDFVLDCFFDEPYGFAPDYIDKLLALDYPIDNPTRILERAIGMASGFFKFFEFCIEKELAVDFPKIWNEISARRDSLPDLFIRYTALLYSNHGLVRTDYPETYRILRGFQ